MSDEGDTPKAKDPKAGAIVDPEGSQQRCESIEDLGDLVDEAIKRMDPTQGEATMSRAADEAFKLAVKQCEGAIDQRLERSAVTVATGAAGKLLGEQTVFEVRTEQRSEHGSIYVTVRSAPPPIVARLSPRANRLTRWISTSVVVALAAAGTIVVVNRGSEVPPSLDAPHTSAPPTEPRGEVIAATKFIDGDTIVVTGLKGGSMEERVRLLAIDTPERGQRWHDEARDALQGIVGHRPIRLEFESPGVMKRDKYGRVLAYLIVDGENANVEMVRRGWTAYVTKYASDRFAKDFVSAEEEARAAHRGIWSLR